MTFDLAFLTIAEASALIQVRQLSPVEYVEALITRTETFDPQLHAYITPTFDLARQQAKQAEHEIMAGTYHGPMHGIPFALKDIYDTQGIRTSGHSKVCLHRIPEANATTTGKLYEAGAILMGKLATYDRVIRDLEHHIMTAAQQHDPQTLERLRSVPGIGPILSLVLLYEIHDIHRFPRVQDFASYCRVVKCAHESAGKRYGTSGHKIGNVHLKWAFSEAAVLCLVDHPPGQKYYGRLEKQYGPGKALTVLAHKLARAVYYLLKRQTTFDMDTFIRG